MIFEHEIPTGSRLYFGQSAKLKRNLENQASEAFEALGYEEIVVPSFSYHQHESFNDKRCLVRVNDENNHEVTLRADITADLVRIVTKRIGRSVNHKKWYYIQPTLSFPTKEQYQIGAEVIDGSFEESINNAIEMLGKFGIEPVLQIANIKIPRILHDEHGIDYEILRTMNMEKILELDIEWVVKLANIHHVEDLQDIEDIPSEIAYELNKIYDASRKIRYKKVVISPLYYANMRYYDSLTFRVFEDNRLLAQGGTYHIDDCKASGFTIYTDRCIESIIKRDKGNNE
ncbi:MAG: ATP phosphoribosyltransferase regulatory subunit [Campylobacterales bacterium]|nr:ATP phosphoribosyltransferase regulatory subunit [Campylobacterales bacterium]